MSSTVFDLSDRVVVVTGAAGLLGRRFATAAAEAGAHVVAADLEPGPVEALAWDLKERFGHDALGAAVDITSPASVDALRDRVLARFDRVDGLVNNAAINDMF
ncbi:MAG: SDR family NAD(P)-dependent oxidoreductase, partial [Myxococcales bacterium]|nr:SDR family NAD(P)-dependent oxidoreductase [Myxococcales bacterium]